MGRSELEAALTLRRVDDDLWRAHGDRGYEAPNGMLGGWTAAVTLRAVRESAADDTTPSALTVNFVGSIEPGTDVHIRTRRVGGGRSVSHWHAEVMSPDHDETWATAVVVLANRRESDGRVDVDMPDAPDPATLEGIRPPGPFGERIVMLPVDGFPPFGRPDSRSTSWVRELSGRPVDHQQLVILSDVRPPRSFFWSDAPRPSATLTLSVYFHATETELRAVGDDYLLSESFGTRGAQSTSEEHTRLWSRPGALLSTSQQLAWYR